MTYYRCPCATQHKRWSGCTICGARPGQKGRKIKAELYALTSLLPEKDPPARFYRVLFIALDSPQLFSVHAIKVMMELLCEVQRKNPQHLDEVLQHYGCGRGLFEQKLEQMLIDRRLRGTAQNLFRSGPFKRQR